MKQLFPPLIIFTFSIIFFSYRLLDVPRGITIDEAAFGYNASLISETLRDENGRFLPVFVLSLDGRDWRQPLTQYFQVLTFKIFGRSLFNLKFTSVVVAAISGVLIFAVGKQLFGSKMGLLALLIFVTTPIVMIHTHLALDNIIPIPFILIWLLGIINFEKKKSLRYLILAGVSLGISFYAHKSMRSAAPIWTILTILYLISQFKNWKHINLKNYKQILTFLISVSPFYLISPILDYKYAGAVFGSQDLFRTSFYDFIYFYLSAFDPSFLFIKGDVILHHSTGKHGMFLLSALPLFLYGIYKSMLSKNKFLIFLVICFFAGPLLLGFIGSVHRASRLMFLVPIFTLVSAFGVYEFLKLKAKVYKSIWVIFSLIFVINFYDFINYYWYEYPKDTYHIFYSPVSIPAYKKLKEVSQKENLNPLIARSLLKATGDGGSIEDFSRSLYFTKPEAWDDTKELPEKSILLINRNIKNLKLIETEVNNYYLYIKK